MRTDRFPLPGLCTRDMTACPSAFTVIIDIACSSFSSAPFNVRPIPATRYGRQSVKSIRCQTFRPVSQHGASIHCAGIRQRRPARHAGRMRRSPEVVVARVHCAQHDRRRLALGLRFLYVRFSQGTRPITESGEQRFDASVDHRRDQSQIVRIDFGIPRRPPPRVAQRGKLPFGKAFGLTRRTAVRRQQRPRIVFIETNALQAIASNSQKKPDDQITR